jgi:hypothetical protein
MLSLKSLDAEKTEANLAALYNPLSPLMYLRFTVAFLYLALPLERLCPAPIFPPNF